MIRYLHPRITLTRTLTGRLATHGFPVLGIPKHSEEGKRLRGAMRAPKGFVIQEEDYSQIELRALAHLSGDKAMVDAFKKGIDLHALTAHTVLGAPKDPAKQDDSLHRLPAKTTNFSIAMGTTGHGLADSINRALAENAQAAHKKGRAFTYEPWTVDKADGLLADYFKQYKGIRAWMDGCRDKGEETGYAYGMWGARWYLPGCWSPHDEVREATLRQTHALPIQEGAQRLIKQAMRKVWTVDLPWAWKQKAQVEPILQIHDSLIFRTEETFHHEWHARLNASMATITVWKVPIKADGKYGPTWLEQNKYGDSIAR